ncbi:NAD(P)/FAD-dependent oxidoreductase [Marinobacterium weihaiense]|uniref:NAD(P)-binding protein n=1 Tax=Marinobacterium weihaiense TaxID=2851016 RepID=A0ABS6M7J8_9GAMM|nr:FAD-dependent oxidoreductase [Marinobacterium weihaiense]MBV0932256.1 NAD(P)-binding protein [Marinobacterium weihaiense]
MTAKQRVAIVGAGLAGSLVAFGLRRRGCTPDVFDKSRGTGGRLAAARLGGSSADLGAPMIPTDLANELRALSPELPIQAWTVQVANFQLELQGERSLQVPVPRASALTRQLLEGTTLYTQSRVRAIEPLDAGWQLVMDDDSVHGPYDRVVLAVPGPQAVPLLAAVPALQQRAQEVVMAPAWVMLAEQPACPEALAEIDWLEGEHPVLARICRDCGKPQRSGNIWQLQAREDWSAAHVDAHPDWIAEQLLHAVSDLAGAGFTPVTQRVHRWLYSQVAVSPGSEPLSPCGTLGVCGDWVGGAGLEGAWHSAQRLLAAFDTGR